MNHLSVFYIFKEHKLCRALNTRVTGAGTASWPGRRTLPASLPLTDLRRISRLFRGHEIKGSEYSGISRSFLYFIFHWKWCLNTTRPRVSFSALCHRRSLNYFISPLRMPYQGVWLQYLELTLVALNPNVGLGAHRSSFLARLWRGLKPHGERRGVVVFDKGWLGFGCWYFPKWCGCLVIGYLSAADTLLSYPLCKRTG